MNLNAFQSVCLVVFPCFTEVMSAGSEVIVPFLTQMPSVADLLFVCFQGVTRLIIGLWGSYRNGVKSNFCK